MSAHQHRWRSTAQDGVPHFTCNRQMWSGYRAHVQCDGCGARTWVTREEWDAERQDGAPSVARVTHATDGYQREAWKDRDGDLGEETVDQLIQRAEDGTA